MVNKHGSGVTFELDDTADALTDVSAYVDTSALQQAIELADTTAYQDADRTYIAGLANATVPIGGPWDSVFDAVLGTSTQRKVARGIRYRPEGDTSPSYTAEAFIKDYSTNQPVGERVSWSATLRITGAVTRA